jgi:phosphoribosylamine--glycine ligase
MREARFGAAGARVLVEERLFGEEASFYAISDGERFCCLAAAQDFKRALDEDRGENTGGMGSYSPAPVVTQEIEQKIIERIVRPTLAGMRAEGRPYRGVLYVGVMVVDGEPRVIEFNGRFGDPETQALLARLESDLVPLLHAAAVGRLPDDAQAALHFGPAAVCVVMASEGYPRSYPVDLPIQGLERAEASADVVVFHSGTRRSNEGFATAGGRVLGVTARGPSIRVARDRAYAAVREISWKGAHYRTDIAAAAAECE